MKIKFKFTLLTILTLILLNCTNVFASETEKYDFTSIINSFYFMSDTVKQNLINNESERFNNEIIENNYMTVIYAMQNGTDYIYFYFYNTNSAFVYNNTSNFSSWNPSTNYTGYRLTVSNGYRTSTSTLNTPRMGSNNLIYGIFSETGFQTNIYDSFTGVGTYGIMDTSKWTYIEGYKPQIKQPYFEFNAKKIGTTTLENVDGNINTYYKSSFDGYVNSYTSNDEIGYLYLPPEYYWENIFYPKLFIYKNNLEQTKQWAYTGYDFYKMEETTEYKKYIITVDQNIITSPYYYKITLKALHDNFNDIDINFVVINEPAKPPIIENVSGDKISGEQIEDNTTIGDFSNTVQETINNLFEINSGDVEQILNDYDLNLNVENNSKLEENILNTLKGEPEDFIISWDTVNYMNTPLIPSGDINFSKVARDNEAIGEAKMWLNVICSMALILLIGAHYWSTICSFLGIRKDIYETYTEEGDLLIATSEEDLRQGYENPRGYAEIKPDANKGIQDRKHYPSNWHG